MLLLTSLHEEQYNRRKLILGYKFLALRHSNSYKIHKSILFITYFTGPL